ncbi:MAG: hypothetical protein OXC44_02180 [Proteobacteria bacterium]|nr:hypothetical protein [Pseudomonadota bacterium]
MNTVLTMIYLTHHMSMCKNTWKHIKTISFHTFCLIVLMVGVVSCRTQFNYIFGTEQELVIKDDALTVYTSHNKLTTQGHKDSLLTLQARCTLNNNPVITWDLGDGSEKKLGTHITHRYAFAKNYKVTATCENDLRVRAQKSILIQVEYKNPLQNP